MRFEGESSRTSFAMFVDLDNDGDLDLFVGTHTHPGKKHRHEKQEQQSTLFENTGDGHFRDVTPQDGPGNWPNDFAARNATAIDLNHDGLLDLVLADGAYRNWTTGQGRLVMLQNQGHWKFKDVSKAYNAPDKGAAGAGMAIGDVNDDGLLDIFIADSNRLFVTHKTGTGWRFEEAEAGRFVGPRGGDHGFLNCGAAFGDLDGDGKLDLVTTVHGLPGQIDVYLNRTTDDGEVHFKHVTKETGLPMLLPSRGITGQKVKGAHVAIQDMDDDGRMDMVFAILWRNKDGKDQPLVLRNLGLKNGVPQFDTSPMDKLVVYAAPAPVVDYDRDGRLDFSFVSWFGVDEQAGTRLYRNVSDVGHHLTVKVVGDGEHVNPVGIGSTVRLYKAGQLGKPDALLGRQDVTIGQGYSGSTEPRLYFGLGDTDTCDVLVTYLDQRVELRNVAAGQTLEVHLPAQSQAQAEK